MLCYMAKADRSRAHHVVTNLVQERANGSHIPLPTASCLVEIPGSILYFSYGLNRVLSQNAYLEIG